MKIALLQERHNRLYSFENSQKKYQLSEVYNLMEQMEEQNLNLMKEAAEKGADIALTSEAVNFPGQPSWVDGDIVEIIAKTQGNFVSKCSAIAGEAGMYIAVGMYRVKEDGKLYNSILVFDRKGEITFTYDKNFLAGAEKEYLTPGDKFPLWNSEFGKIGVCICWDMQFPETARAYALQGADLILCATWGWEYLYGQARAYENGIYVAAGMAVPDWRDIEGVRSPSQVIAPEGNILAEGPRDRAEAVVVQIPDIRDCRESRDLRTGDLVRRFPKIKDSLRKII